MCLSSGYLLRGLSLRKKSVVRYTDRLDIVLKMLSGLLNSKPTYPRSPVIYSEKKKRDIHGYTLLSEISDLCFAFKSEFIFFSVISASNFLTHTRFIYLVIEVLSFSRLYIGNVFPAGIQR